jgi:hypothetical protein
MGMSWKQAALVAAGVAALCGATCMAQDNSASQGSMNQAQAGQAQAGRGQANATAPARASAVEGPEFSIGVGGYEAINESTNGNGTQQTTTNSGGGMLELRLIASPLAGFEFTYSYNTANQTIQPSANCASYSTCASPSTALSAKASEVGLDYVASKKFGSLRPFAVGGLGFFITSPSNSKYEVTTVVRPAYIAGGGVDWALMRHLGARLQVRGNFYKAPNLSAFNPPTGEFTHTLEPMGGFYYSF